MPTAAGATDAIGAITSEAILIALSQLAGRPSINGAASRCSRSSWYVNRPSSHIQYLLTSGLRRGTRRHARPCLWWISMLQPVAQPLHTLGVASSSQARICLLYTSDAADERSS